MAALKSTAAAYRSCRRQRGQALVFVTVTILVMVIAMLMTYSIGQLTNQKTRLQNTADAAAYSAALAQARDYNFSAYMNRAMIANDVSVAQQIALRSWVSAFNEAFKTNGLAYKYSPAGGHSVQAGPLYFIWNGAETLARGAAKAMEGALNTFTPLYVNGIYYINQLLSLSQKTYHYSTTLTVAQTTGWIETLGSKIGGIIGISALGDITEKFNKVLTMGVESNVIKMNDPNARLSTLGMLAFIYDTQKWLAFTENRNPVGPWGQDHEQKNKTETRRRCSISNEADWATWFQGIRYRWDGGDFAGHCPLFWGIKGAEVIKPGEIDGAFIDVDYTVPNNADRDYTIAPLRDSTDDNLFREYDGTKKERYANVVIDMLDEFTTDRNAGWKFPVGMPYVGFVDFLLIAGSPSLKPPSWSYKNVAHESEGVELWNDEKEDTNVGVGKGYKKLGSWNRRWKTSDTVDLWGMSSQNAPPVFGWIFNFPVPAPPLGGPYNFPASTTGYESAEGSVSTGDATDGGQSLLAAKKSSRNTTHLSDNPIFRKYRDVTNIEQGTDTANQNWTSPPLLIEIERSTRTVLTSDQSRYSENLSGCTSEVSAKAKPVKAVFEEGNFRLGDGSSSTCMRAMAKAEAYFSKPTDLFEREDKKTEYGSLYSPYWQARLVKTTPSEQTISLFFQYCDGKGSLWGCVTGLLNSARAVNQGIWSSLGNLKSYLAP